MTRTGRHEDPDLPWWTIGLVLALFPLSKRYFVICRIMYACILLNALHYQAKRVQIGTVWKLGQIWAFMLVHVSTLSCWVVCYILADGRDPDRPELMLGLTDLGVHCPNMLKRVFCNV